MLTARDLINLDAFLEHVLEDYKNGTITMMQARSGLAHMISALDNGEATEVRSWVEQGRKFIRRL